MRLVACGAAMMVVFASAGAALAQAVIPPDITDFQFDRRPVYSNSLLWRCTNEVRPDLRYDGMVVVQRVCYHPTGDRSIEKLGYARNTDLLVFLNPF